MDFKKAFETFDNSKQISGEKLQFMKKDGILGEYSFLGSYYNIIQDEDNASLHFLLLDTKEGIKTPEQRKACFELFNYLTDNPDFSPYYLKKLKDIEKLPLIYISLAFMIKNQNLYEFDFYDFSDRSKFISFPHQLVGDEMTWEEYENEPRHQSEIQITKILIKYFGDFFYQRAYKSFLNDILRNNGEFSEGMISHEKKLKIIEDFNKNFENIFADILNEYNMSHEEENSLE